ncbi:MAG TPA: hypothetical protein VK203_28475 [Nostocaceae cyanobacterium]|nr:hypothetical protein [Nostocaceae cyanobacterium]
MMMVEDTKVAKVVKEQSENQVLVCQKSEVTSTKLVCAIESQNATISQPLDPNQLVQVGGSSVAVILAIGFLILALAEYNKVFIPVMMRGEKRE